MTLVMTKPRNKKPQTSQQQVIIGRIIKKNSHDRTLMIQGGWTENYRTLTLAVDATVRIKKNGTPSAFNDLKTNERISAQYIENPDPLKKALTISAAK